MTLATREYLRELTGYRQPAKQAIWLQNKLGLRVVRSRTGSVAITHEVINAAMLSSKKPKAEPNW
jgi:hypothetical protein